MLSSKLCQFLVCVLLVNVSLGEPQDLDEVDPATTQPNVGHEPDVLESEIEQPENEEFTVNGNRQTPVISVINGTPVSHGTFPAHAVLVIGYEFFCGGTLISSRHVLTAAHCISWIPEDARQHVRIYFNTARLAPLDSGARIRGVRKAWIHPEFSIFVGNITTVNDIAILLLDAPVRNIRPVRLAGDLDNYVGAQAVTYGFGVFQQIYPSESAPTRTQSRQSDSSTSNDLRKGNVQVISNQECLQTYPLGENNNDDSQYLCAAGSQSPCYGDDGGSLLVRNTQIGIVSFGVDGCDTSYPFVYTRVSYYQDWIQSVLYPNGR